MIYGGASIPAPLAVGSMRSTAYPSYANASIGQLTSISLNARTVPALSAETNRVLTPTVGVDAFSQMTAERDRALFKKKGNQNSFSTLTPQYVQPAVQQNVLPAMQQYIQPTVQQCVQPAVQQYVQPAMQQYVQPTVQQYITPPNLDQYTVAVGTQFLAERSIPAVPIANQSGQVLAPETIRLPTGEIVEYALPPGVTLQDLVLYEAEHEVPHHGSVNTTVVTTQSFVSKAQSFVSKAEHEVVEVFHEAEDAAVNAFHTAEHAVENVAEHAVEVYHKVEGAVKKEVHEIHKKVSNFFGMIGDLFHSGKHHGGTGPGGTSHGKGSLVEVMRMDGVIERGHLEEDISGEHCYVQLHSTGRVTQFPSSAVSLAASYEPVVGGGVEILYEGAWYPGVVRSLPVAGEEPAYVVHCYGDEPDQLTLIGEGNMRPLLSQEEKLLVHAHMEEIAEQKAIEAEQRAKEERIREAERESRRREEEEKRAQERKKEEDKKLTLELKTKMERAGLGSFYEKFVEGGYDTEATLPDVHEAELSSFGMKPGHIGKFYEAFPQGLKYVVSNNVLQSPATGIAYRYSKDMDQDSHKIAPFGSIIVGTEQVGGFLKVGNMYLPMKEMGKSVIFLEGKEPPVGTSETMVMVDNVKDKVKETIADLEENPIVASVEDKIHEKWKDFAHMLHFD